MTITVIEKTLSDGSKVYDVRLSGDCEAVSFEDAYDLANGIGNLVEKHTNTVPTIRELHFAFSA